MKTLHYLQVTLLNRPGQMLLGDYAFRKAKVNKPYHQSKLHYHKELISCLCCCIFFHKFLKVSFLPSVFFIINKDG